MVQAHFDADSAVITFRFQGRMDTAACDGAAVVLEEEMGKRLAEAQSNLQARFDLAETTYVTSAFFRICIVTAKKVEQGKFAVINTPPALKKVFKMASLDELLAVS